MVFEALELMRTELAAYLQPPRDATAAEVALGSIAGVAGAGPNQVLISLMGVEEDAALRNGSPSQRPAVGGSGAASPPASLSLLVLIGANFADNATYPTALKRLARTVQCFQQKPVFTAANAPTDGAAAVRLRVAVNLHSPSFEQLSQLWGTLGGKQVPFVLYNLRVAEEQAGEMPGPGPAIVQRLKERPGAPKPRAT